MTGGGGSAEGLEFRLLGPLEALKDGQPLRLGGKRQRALLALLLLHANEVVSSDRVIDELFDGQASDTTKNAVQAAVSRLRRALEDDGSDDGRVLVTRSPGYVLEVAAEQVDLARFERLLAEGRHELAGDDHQGAASTLREALDLWRGTPFADIGSHDFAERELRRLGELRLAAILARIEAELALGHHTELVSELEMRVAEHPSEEHLHAQLMLALYRCGRQSEALAAYRAARRQLVEEHGIEPSPELQELQRAILRQDASLAAPMPQPELRTSIRLPEPANRLIGRRAELRALSDLLLGEARLVTVTGAGGSGKTRLALEVAATLKSQFAERVFFVSLAPLRQPDLLATTIMSALELKEAPGEPPLKTLTSVLRGQRSLLVLDNFEHLLDSAAVPAELLSACPQLKLLVTSRAALHLTGEHEYGLKPLPSMPAIVLFSERAKAVRSDFAAEGTVLTAICTRLDCLPLALELAAARCRVLSAEELLSRLEHSLEVLTGGPRDLAARHQTLRATIDWSYSVLDTDEQQLFARFAVFVGGCTLEAAEQICSASFELLESLVDKSLLRHRETGSESRFWMLETIREFALERLASSGGAEQARRSHADYYLALAQRWAPDLEVGRGATLDALERELNNFRAAFAWAMECDSELALQLAAALSGSWYDRRQLVEGRRWFEAVLSERLRPSRELAVVLVELAKLQLFLDERELAARSAEEALELAEHLEMPELVSDVLNTKAVLAKVAGAYEEAIALLKRALAVAREQDRPRPLLRALHNLAYFLVGEDRYQEALALAQEGVTRSRELGGTAMEARLLSVVSAACLYLGQWDRAFAVAEEMKQITRTAPWGSSLPTLHAWRGDVGEARRAHEAQAHATSGEELQLRAYNQIEEATVLRAEGRSGEALTAAMDAFAVRAALGEREPMIREAFVVAVEAAFDLDDLVQVRELLDWSEQLPPSDRSPFLEAQNARFAALLAARRGECDDVESGLTRASSMFRELSMRFHLALTLLDHGEWLVTQGRADEAESFLVEAHEIFARLGAKPYLERTKKAQSTQEARAHT